MKRVLVLVAAVCVSVMVFAQDAAEKINQAKEAMEAKDYAKAFELYDAAMGNLGDVQVPEAINYNIGYAGYKSKNYEKAIGYFEKAIAAEANVGKCYDYMASSYTKLKQYDKAVETYEKAIAVNPDEKSIYYNAGIAAYKGKTYEKAAGFFSKSVEAGYKAESAQYYKAVVTKKAGDAAGYKAALEEGVEKFGSDKKLKDALANVYVSEGNEMYKKGAAIISAANKKVNSGAMTTADDAYTKEIAKAKEQFESASKVLEKAKELDATNANATKLLEACKAQLK